MNNWWQNRKKHTLSHSARSEGMRTAGVLGVYDQDFCEQIIRKYTGFGIYGFAGISLIFLQKKKENFLPADRKPDITLQFFYKTFVYHQSFRKNVTERQSRMILPKQIILRSRTILSKQRILQSRTILSKQIILRSRMTLQKQIADRAYPENRYLPGSAGKMQYLNRSSRGEEAFFQILSNLYERKRPQQESQSIRRAEEQEFLRRAQEEQFLHWQEIHAAEKKAYWKTQSGVLRNRISGYQLLGFLRNGRNPDQWDTGSLISYDLRQDSRYVLGSIQNMQYRNRRSRVEEALFQILRNLYEKKRSQQESRNIQKSESIEKESRSIQKSESIEKESRSIQKSQRIQEIQSIRQTEEQELLRRVQEERFQQLQNQFQREIAVLAEGRNTSERQIEAVLYQLERRNLTEEYYLTEEERREAAVRISRFLHWQEIHTAEERTYWRAQSGFLWDRIFGYQISGFFRNSRNPDHGKPNSPISYDLQQDSQYALESIQNMQYRNRRSRREKTLFQILRNLYEKKWSQQESRSIQKSESIEKESRSIQKSESIEKESRSIQKSESIENVQRIQETENIGKSQRIQEIQSIRQTEEQELLRRVQGEQLLQLQNQFQKRLQKEITVLAEERNTSERQIEAALYQLERRNLTEEYYLTEEERREAAVRISRFLHWQEIHTVGERTYRRTQAGFLRNRISGYQISGFFRNGRNPDHGKQYSPISYNLRQDSRYVLGSIQNMQYRNRRSRREKELFQILYSLYEKKWSQQESRSIQKSESIEKENRSVQKSESIEKKSRRIQEIQSIRQTEEQEFLLRAKEERFQQLQNQFQKQLQKEIAVLTEERNTSERQIEAVLYQLERRNLTEEYYLTEEERREAAVRINRLLRRQEIHTAEERTYRRTQFGFLRNRNRRRRREEAIFQILRNRYGRKRSHIQEEHFLQLQNRLKREIFLFAEEPDSTESRTAKRIETLLYRLERKNLTEECYLTEEERRETAVRISRLLYMQETSPAEERAYRRKQAGVFLNRISRHQRSGFLRNIRSLKYRSQNGTVSYNLRQSSRYEKKLSGQETRRTQLQDRLLETITRTTENRRIADTQLELRREQALFRSREVQAVQKERAAENVLLKKETVLVRKSVEEQENRIHVLQEELQRQKKEMESLAGKISGAAAASAANPERVTEQVLREMQRQFRLEKARRGM